MERILVVDDDSDLVDLISSFVGSHHPVVGTDQPTRAIELIQGGGIWLLITDIRMPGLNGFQLIERAKTLCSRLAVLVVSAFYDDSEPLARQVLERYADLALPKPVSCRAVNDAVARLEHAGRLARRA